MRVERRYADANVSDGKIYVAGGCSRDNDSSKWMEVSHPKIKAWETLLCLVAKICENEISKSAMIEGEIGMLINNTAKGVAYKPKEDKWENKWQALGGRGLSDIEYTSCSYCVIDNVLYCYPYPWGIQWYDTKGKQWVNLLSLDELPKIYKYSSVQLVCYGGKMAVLWDKNLGSSGSGEKNKTIWCAVIALEKLKNKKEIWGDVESVDDGLLTVPSSYEVVSALAATL